LAEAESELVGGFHTEYSGMRWSFFFMGEYASMYAVSAIAAILFLGAWHTGIPGLDGQLIQLRLGGGVGSYAANVFGAGVMASKAAFLVFVQIWLRWTLPRLRIDQVMMTCLKYLIPISCVLFLGTVIWPMAMRDFTGRTTWGEPLGESVERAQKLATPKSDSGSGEETTSLTLPVSVEQAASAAQREARR
ncbi:MAG: NADH-quinone oxidoreductase subunit H, partial [Phycisphaerales bacterium]|nr:NADH-quinone oxidoreductase subunit H [Phycisphaerales bacterium]